MPAAVGGAGVGAGGGTMLGTGVTGGTGCALGRAVGDGWAAAVAVTKPGSKASSLTSEAGSSDDVAEAVAAAERPASVVLRSPFACESDPTATGLPTGPLVGTVFLRSSLGGEVSEPGIEKTSGETATERIRIVMRFSFD